MRPAGHMDLALSTPHLSALLALIGLLFELGAIASVAWKFRPNLLRRRKPIEVQLSPAEEVSDALTLKWTGSAEESYEPPLTLQSLRDEIQATQRQMRAIQADLEG